MRRSVLVGVMLVCGSVVPGAGIAGANVDDTPAHGRASNMGLCSPFLGQLGVRPLVNQLVREMGAYLPDGPYENVGELYRVRAKEKPTAPAASECLPRRPDGSHQSSS
jgi:hypothetical protein